MQIVIQRVVCLHKLLPREKQRTGDNCVHQFVVNKLVRVDGAKCGIHATTRAFEDVAMCRRPCFKIANKRPPSAHCPDVTISAVLCEDVPIDVRVCCYYDRRKFGYLNIWLVLYLAFDCHLDIGQHLPV